MRVLVCTEWDDVAQSCTVEAWVPWPGVIPPLPAEQGVQLSMAMWGILGLAWGYRAVRRFIAPRFG